MSDPWQRVGVLVALAIHAGGALAQGSSVTGVPEKAQQGKAQQGKALQGKAQQGKGAQEPNVLSDLRASRFGRYASYGDMQLRGDVVEITMSNGVRLPFGQTELRADSVVITVDRDEFYRLSDTRQPAGLPARGMAVPDARRVLSGPLLVRRFEHFLQSLGRPPAAPQTTQADLTRLLRSIYLRGHVVVTQNGIEALTAASLLLSVPDNRAVFEDVELRLVTRTSKGLERTLVVRAPRLVKQGFRTSGRKVSLTTCEAGKPHFEVFSGEVEIIERESQFEVFSRDNTLAFSGRGTLPFPDAHFFTREQSQFPVKGISGGYSETEGTELHIDLGGPMNDLGGAVHRLLTGRNADEFRGDWRLGVGWNETRGYPLDLDLYYEGGKAYEGRFNGFLLQDDGGRDLFFIRNNIDGSPITERDRSIIHTENRLSLGHNWTADISLFSASDPGVWSEFFQDHFNEYEIPESSVHVRHAEENRLFTVTGRTNLATFTYGDDRALSPSFREELPLATYDVFSQKLLEVGHADLLVTSETEAGVLRHEFDPRFPAPIDDETTRLDQKLELAAPFVWGGVAVRPYASARFTYYDNTVSGAEAERWALDAGVSLTTRFARTFSGSDSKLRHSIYPSVSFGHLYQVDGRPADFHQFDEIDSLSENGVIRVGLLNRFETGSVDARGGGRSTPEGPEAPGGSARDPRNRNDRDLWRTGTAPDGARREVLWIDLAQNFLPISGRDNGGEVLGLLEYELIWRGSDLRLPGSNLRLMVEGEHDWRDDRMRTFNTVLAVDDLLGFDWTAGYRTDYLSKGTVQYGARTDVFGRWNLLGMGAYDLETSKQLLYGFYLTRMDHDWNIRLDVVYNFISADTSVNINFQPLFGGLFRQRSRQFGGMDGRGAEAMFR